MGCGGWRKAERQHGWVFPQRMWVCVSEGYIYTHDKLFVCVCSCVPLLAAGVEVRRSLQCSLQGAVVC